MFFSCIIPVYNRPGELKDLLSSLLSQTYTQFEVVVVEDGSTLRCDEVVASFSQDLSIRYFYQENTGQGFARNFGMQQAKGDFFVILDSDVLLPPAYFECLQEAIQSRSLDAFGGPDAAAADFSPLQKAMDFAMTSFWTTGGFEVNSKIQPPTKHVDSIWVYQGRYLLVWAALWIPIGVRISNGAFGSRRRDFAWSWLLRLLSTTNEKIRSGPLRSRAFPLEETGSMFLAFTPRQSSWCMPCRVFFSCS